MAFNRQTIVDAMAGQMALVPGIGIVHTQRRVMRTYEDVARLTFHPTQERVNGWFVSPALTNTALVERHPGFSGIGTVGDIGTIFATLQFQIEGYFGIDDANDSEQTFFDLAFAVAMRFNKIGKLLHESVEQLPCDIEAFSYVMFVGGYHAHYARLGFGLKGRIT